MFRYVPTESRNPHLAVVGCVSKVEHPMSGPHTLPLFAKGPLSSGETKGVKSDLQTITVELALTVAIMYN